MLMTLRKRSASEHANEFVDDKEWSDKPNSRDCDEFLEGYGGEIKLDGHLHLINTYVDCIWIVGRFPHMARTFDRIYLKVWTTCRGVPHERRGTSV
ncbi:hypothetical protein OESDEN_24507, partial [Oesophagostomum dentatum]